MPLHPPSVDALATQIDDGRLPRPVLLIIARNAIAESRTNGADAGAIANAMVTATVRHHQSPVINATGVLLHTNLGRAPLHPEAIAAMVAAAANATPLEMDLTTGSRGRRGHYASTLLCALTGAEAALVTNNNAGALLLAVAAIAAGNEVIVSRGEQIEIGGSFRLPGIVLAAGAIGVEVGTTNRTRRKDYEKAISEKTRMMLKVHPSNYRVEGFTEGVSYRDLAVLGKERSVPVVADVGSGLLDDRVPWLRGSPPDWLAGEPGVRQTLDDGADLVLFSGDKLLGGPQAGIVVGNADLVARLAEHPLARTIRISGPQLAALTATLGLYADGRAAEIPFWHRAAMSSATLRERCEAVIASSGVGELDSGFSVPGAGSAPGNGIPGPIIAVDNAGEPARIALLENDPPVVARVHKNRLVVDLRAVDPSDDPAVAKALAIACRS